MQLLSIDDLDYAYQAPAVSLPRCDFIWKSLMQAKKRARDKATNRACIALADE